MGIKFDTGVQEVVYYISKEQGVRSMIMLQPSVMAEDGTKLDSICSSLVTNAEGLCLNQGDKIRVYCYEGESAPSVTIELLSLVPGRRFAIKPHICPTCGSRLVVGRDGASRCLNRACPSQAASNIYTFANAMGLSAQKCPAWGAVVASLLHNGALPSPEHLFYVNPEQCDLPDVTQSDFALFQRHTHLIRGNVSIGKLLQALDVPNWMEGSYSKVDSIFKQNNWDLQQAYVLLDPSIVDKYPSLDWGSWFEFIGIGDNRNIFLQLAHILYR